MPFTQLTNKDKGSLLKVARHAIQYGLRYNKAPVLELEQYSENLQRLGSAFVTLKETSKLRGCVGSLEAQKALVQDVSDHAFAAAFKDPRFPPVNTIEEPLVHISISIINPPEEIKATNEGSLLRQLSPGHDGVIINFKGHQATYLPTVWEQLPEPELFIQQLKRKAGLDADFWDPAMKIYRYSTVNID